MSMLAERKVKQKWSLNPRGKDWSEDSNKFGQKMLEKMGWSKGKGLGPKQNGISEHIKISYKNDSKGMGYKDRNDQWTKHDTNFTALLQSLSGEKPPENNVTVSSLEEKSQKSRVRVHYKKFTRGKDLTRWSEKDLANIFGKRSLKDTRKVSDSEDSNEVKENHTDSSFIHNGGSMVDYFKKKLPNFGKNNAYVVGNNGVLTKEEESEDEGRVGFGFEKKRKGNDVVNGTPKKMKLEEIQEEKGLINPAFDPMCSNIEVKKHVLNTILEESEETVINIKKNKKKSEKVTNDVSDIAIDNSTAESQKKKKKKTSSSDEIIEHTLEATENELKNNNSEGSVKKKKQSTAVINPSFQENDDDFSTPKNNIFEVKRKKKKNTEISASENEDSCQNNSVHAEVKIKKKQKNCGIFPGVDNPNFDKVEDNESNNYNNDYEVKRKKKKKNEAPGIENQNFDNTEDSQNCSHNDFEVKRKKKKNENSGIENPNFDVLESSQNSFQNNEYEVRRKMKGGKSSSGIENPNFDIKDASHNSYNDGTFEVTRKKKKDGENSSGIENPNFDVTDASENSYNDSTFEVKRKKKKKKDLAIDNPSFTSANDSLISKKEETAEKSLDEPCFDLVLNVTSTPTLPKPESSKQSSSKRRKNVRFSNVNQEHIIPNKEDVDDRNELFDINSRVIANGLNDTSTNLDLDEISKKIDGFQAEVENDINEAKVVKFIGEVGNSDGKNEKLPDGTKLKFKYANFGKSPFFPNKSTSKSKTSYKHLIKGDIILGFKNTNLHEIVGYGIKNKT